MFNCMCRKVYLPAILYNLFPYVVFIITLILGFIQQEKTMLNSLLLIILFMYSIFIVAIRSISR